MAVEYEGHSFWALILIAAMPVLAGQGRGRVHCSDER
jgi:hypothetical protein